LDLQTHNGSRNDGASLLGLHEAARIVPNLLYQEANA
jgi:hypothetical protein